MPVEILIPDAAIVGFNDQAQAKLKEVAGKYSNDIIEEANRLEAGHNTGQGPPEVTSSMVTDADTLLRRGLAQKKKNFGRKILNIGSSVASLGVGILYDKNSLQSAGYLFLFVIVIAAAILLLTLSTLNE
jgi:hypothetical protein